MVKVDDGTGEVSQGQWPTAIVIADISRRGEIQGDALSEVGGVHSTGDGEDNITSPEGRDPTSTVSSETVSDGACPNRANNTQSDITRRSAQTMPVCQAETVPNAGLMWQVKQGVKYGNRARHRKKVVGEPYEGKPCPEPAEGLTYGCVSS